MVNVTKENFVEASEDLLKQLKTASYVAIDEEMTGISLPGEKPPLKDDTPELRYKRLKEIPERYSIISVGISLFHKNPNYVSDAQQQNRQPVEATGEGAAIGDGNGVGEELSDVTEPEYIARPYNFYIFPSSSREARDVTLSPAAIKFLNDHGMDFSMWTRNGVGYLNTQQSEELLAKIKQKLINEEQQETDSASAGGAVNSISTTPSDTNRKIVLTKTQDIQFVGRATAAVREWLDNAVHHPNASVAEDGSNNVRNSSTFVLPPCNAFLRRALYETLGESYPSLILERGESGEYKDRIVVHRLSEEEKIERAKEKKRKEVKDLKLTIGFYRIFRAISDAAKGVFDPQEDDLANVNYLIPQPQQKQAKKVEADESAHQNSAINDCDTTSKDCGIPIIVHNGLMDLLFLMTHFHEPVLPETWLEAKALVHGFFPKVFDTKYLAEECSPLVYQSTTLGDMFSFWQAEDQNAKRVQLASEFKERYSMGTTSITSDSATGTPSNGRAGVLMNTNEKASGAHEAAYDAFMTGSLYYHICQSIISGHRTNGAVSNDSSHTSIETFHKCSHLGMNKLFCWGSLYNLDLANPVDPFKRGFHPRGIFRVSKFDGKVSTRDIHSALSGAERLKYEILWVDDVTFLVVTKTEDSSIDGIPYDTAARTIQEKLTGRFGSRCVSTFENYLVECDQSSQSKKMGTMGYLLSGVMSYFGGRTTGGGNKRKRTD